MALFNATDANTGSPIFAPAQVNKTPNSVNQDALYKNNTPSAFITNETVGVFGIAANEISAYSGSVPHTGWNLRTTGSGGRAGRVFHECLVAGGMATDAVADPTIVITGQPSDNSVANNAAATFSVTAQVTPNASLTYQWQVWGGASFSDITANSIWTNVTTSSFVIVHALNASANGKIFRVRVMSTGAVNVFSSNATLTVAP
jgi:hypothetical protein